MSYKAFYQTFYQTEQLFRRTDEALTFPATEQVDIPAVETVDMEAPEPVAPPAPPTISDPKLPTPWPSANVPVAVVDGVDNSALEAPVSEPLVEGIHPTVEPAQPSPQPTVSSGGGDAKPLRPATPLISQKVLILVDEDLQPSELLFLEKVLKAVNLEVQGVELLNVRGTKNIDFKEVLTGKYIHHFFTFGVPFTRLNLDILMDRYQPVRFEGITFLMADSLPAIESDVALKKKLWEALKKIFQWR